MLYDESRDCPICLAEFRENEPIIELPCSQKHIYHLGCFEQLYNSMPGGERRCAICRQSIEGL